MSDEFEVIIGCDAAHPDRRGGQHVAKHCSAVRILHRASGIAVTCMHERSQHANRLRAWNLLEFILATESIPWTRDPVE